MAGIVFLLHFGLFHVLSCAWRTVGVDAKPLMNWPILSQSVGEFWGKRWNLAFRDITHRFLFRPFAARWSARSGLAAVFLFSGVVHDLVISLPAGAGYGLPTLYFVIQGAAMLVERTKRAKKFGLGEGWRGRAFTAAVVLGPACGLFHPWFAREVVLPFLDAIGAK
jgi:alginate O-acetyltransferase complex protein AlgI